MSTDASDNALVERVAANDDRVAFELLVRRHQSALRNFLRRLTGPDLARADDLAQESFIKAYRSIGAFEGKSQFRTWLFRIAYTTFLNDERGGKPTGEFSEAVHAIEPGFADRADLARDINDALAMLTVRQRAVFDLHYKKGMTQSEVAAALDMPLGTVKSDLTRGHSRLKDILEQRGFERHE